MISGGLDMMDTIGFYQGFDQLIDKFYSMITYQDSRCTMLIYDIIMNKDCYALSISIFQGLGFNILGEIVYGQNNILFSRG